MWRCILADRYVWQKDGATLESSSSLEIRQTHEVSTIHIENPTSRHEGFYQCFASNVFGTAVTVKALLRKASKIYARVCSLSVTLQKSSYRHCIASDLVYLGTVLTILHIVTARQCIAVVMIVCHTSVLCGNGCAGQAALVFFWGHLSIISLWNFVQTLDLNSDRRCWWRDETFCWVCALPTPTRQNRRRVSSRRRCKLDENIIQGINMEL